jgi:hypothetical protein
MEEEERRKGEAVAVVRSMPVREAEEELLVGSAVAEEGQRRW